MLSREYTTKICIGVVVIITMMIIASRTTGIFFETNDDVGMMMLAHGMGLTDRSTDLLIFSNRLQGLIISWIGMPFGQPGYSIYMFAVLAAGLGVLLASLSRLTGSFLMSAMVVAAIGVRPILTPQFTTVATILALSAVAAFVDYRKAGSIGLLAISALLGFLGFLMRLESVGMVILLSLPVLLHPKTFRAPVLLTAFALAALVVCATLWDKSGYSGEDWQQYRSIEGLRVWFTDYQIGSRIGGHKDLLKSVGWSQNDLDLISMWWFFDPGVYSPDRLERLVSSLGVDGSTGFQFGTLQEWYTQLTGVYMLPTLIMSIGFVSWRIARGSFRVLISVIICVVALGSFAFLGHAGAPRVIYSALISLTVLSCMEYADRMSVRFLGVLAFVAAIVSVVLFADKASTNRAVRLAALNGLSGVSDQDVVVVWGDAFPYERLYPAFLRPGEAFPALQMYSLGSDELAPYALARWGGSGSGLVGRIRSIDGVRMIARNNWIDKVGVYCSEHWGSKMKIDKIIDSDEFEYVNISCHDRNSITGN